MSFAHGAGAEPQGASRTIQEPTPTRSLGGDVAGPEEEQPTGEETIYEDPPYDASPGLCGAPTIVIPFVVVGLAGLQLNRKES